MNKPLPAERKSATSPKPSREPCDSGHTQMKTQSPQYLRPNQCAQQMLLQLTGTYEPQRPVRKSPSTIPSLKQDAARRREKMR